MMWMKSVFCSALMAALALTATGTAVASPHEHGVARLDVAVDATRVSIELHTPLHNLLGFERAPRSPAEQEQVQAVLTRLRAADQLFRIDSAAGCTLARVDLKSAVLQLGQGGPVAKGEHAGLEGLFEFSCRAGARAGFIEVGLFEGFPALKRIDMQLSTPRGQIQARLNRPSSRVRLAR